MFDDVFADKKPNPQTRYADFVVSGTGIDDTVDGAIKIKRFKREGFPQILVSVNMLDTGFDCPEVVNLMLARFTKSAILYQQQRGRGTRLATHIKKTHFTMFDFVGVTDYFGDDEEDIEGGFMVPRVPPERPKKPRSLLVLDIHDHIDPASRGWVTLDENGIQVRTEAGKARALELGMRFEGWLLSQPYLTADQARFLGTVGEQIKVNAHSWTSFDTSNLLDPPFSTRGGLARGSALFGDEAKLELVLNSLSQAVFDEAPQGSGTTAETRATTH